MTVVRSVAFTAFLAIAFIMPPSVLAATGPLKDSESASHGDEAATYRVVNTYKYPGFRLIQFNLAVLSHYSYMLISGKQCLVVDPGRDVATYVETAKKEGVKIKGVFLTHNHADFVAGHLELAKAVGCPIYASAASHDQFPHEALQEGAKIEVGEALVSILETPGHTPDGLCGLVAPRKHPDQPKLLLTGDVLFIGSVGRPDLLGGSVSAAALASQSYDTWTHKLSRLPDDVAIFPAHGAGSLCGAHLSDEPTSTLGAQKLSNPYFRHKTRGDYIAAVLDGLPEAPQYFKHNAALNKQGPELIDWQAPLPPELKPEAALTDPARYYVVDLRSPRQYAASHLPNSVNIGLRGRLETWVGIMVPWGVTPVLVGSKAELQEAVQRLPRIGYSARVITWEAWEKSGLPVAQSELIPPAELFARMQTPDSPVIVDVRLPNEWMGLRIGTVVNLPLNRLAELAAGKLDPTQPTVTVCNSAYRSSLAVGLLERLKFTRLGSLDGGSEAWIAAGLPVFGAEVKAAPVAPAVPQREVKLPERLSATELQRLLVDLPGTFDLVDLRPPAAFTDYHLPGAKNVDIADVLANPAHLTGVGPLILVDRDGSLAMMVAGILSQKTPRPLKVLYGGVEAYWAASAFPRPASGALPPPAAKPAPPPGAHPAAPTPPAAPKKKSAGC